MFALHYLKLNEMLRHLLASENIFRRGNTCGCLLGAVLQSTAFIMDTLSIAYLEPEMSSNQINACHFLTIYLPIAQAIFGAYLTFGPLKSSMYI